MRNKTTKIREQVGIAEYPIYDMLSEAIEDIGEERCLELINAQSRTNEMNRVRAAARPGGVSKSALRDKAFAALASNPSDIEALMACGGDLNKIQALVEKKMEELRSQVPVPVGAPEVGDNGDEEDEE